MEKDREIVFETPYWEVILMDQQLYLGRCVVVLKRPCGDLANLNQDEVLDFFEVIKKLEDLLRKTFGATMFNWGCLMNDAYKVSPAKPQVHWHCRPRYKNPVEVYGNIFKDPNFGHHYLRGTDEKVVSKEILKTINSKLQENMKSI